MICFYDFPCFDIINFYFYCLIEVTVNCNKPVFIVGYSKFSENVLKF